MDPSPQIQSQVQVVDPIYPKHNKKRGFISFLVILFMYWIISYILGLDSLDVIRNVYFNATAGFIFLPLSLLPGGFFVLSGGPVAIPNPIGWLIAPFFCSFIWWMIYQLYCLICKKIGIQKKLLFLFFIILIGVPLFGYLIGKSTINKCIKWNIENRSKDTQDGVIEIYSDRYKADSIFAFDPSKSNRGKYFFSLHKIPEQPNGDFVTTSQNLHENAGAFLKVATGTEDEIVCSINNSSPDISASRTIIPYSAAKKDINIKNNEIVVFESEHLSLEYEANKISEPYDLFKNFGRSGITPPKIDGVVSFTRYNTGVCLEGCKIGSSQATSINVIEYNRPVTIEDENYLEEQFTNTLDGNTKYETMGNYVFKIKEKSMPYFDSDKPSMLYITVVENKILLIWTNFYDPLVHKEVEKVIRTIRIK